MDKNTNWIVGISGASGARYATRLLSILPELVGEVHVVVSDAALRVLQEEEGINCSPSSLSIERLTGKSFQNVIFYNSRDIGARIASGSFITTGMVIVPCSMSSIGALVHGVHSNLLHRAADVVMKEGRKLIVVPRETPLSTLHLENLAALSRAGARILPAMPGFYHRPQSIEQIVDMLVMKILDCMGLPNDLVTRWKSDGESDRE